MRLLWIINGTARDQLQQQFLNYLTRFAACPSDLPRPTAVCMLFVFPADMEGRMVAAFREHGAEVRSLDASRPLSLRSLAACYRAMIEFRPDIIHSQHAIAGVHARLAGTLYRLRRTVCRRGRAPCGRRIRIIGEQRNARHGLSRVARTLERLTFPAANLILCSSPGVEASWFKGSPQRIDPETFQPRTRRHYTFFNSIDVRRLQSGTATLDRHAQRQALGLRPDDIALVTVASLTEQKNYPMLVRAIDLLAKQIAGTDRRIRLLCVGEGDMEPRVRALVDELGLGGQVSLLGYRTDIDRILFACDIFVLSSRWEGLAKALLEAMSLGLPCVATAVEGNVDVITHGTDGLLVASDDAQALAQALYRLIDDPVFAAGLGRRAAEAATRFSVDSQACRLLAIYRRLFNGEA